MKNIKSITPFVIFFSVFTASIPRLLEQQIECLNRYSNAVVEYSNCNVVFVTNRYLLITFISFFITLIIYSLFTKVKSRLNIIMLGFATGLILVFGFYQYLPNAEKVTRESNIYLDTFHQQYAEK